MYSSRLSIKRIVISLAVFCFIPLIAMLINLFINNQTISYTFSINLCGSILIIYDWNLFGIHYNRCKKNLVDAILYFCVGLVLFGILFLLNKYLLKTSEFLPDSATIASYKFAVPAILIAFTYMHALIFNISFKCLTDHMSIHSKELLIILVSGFLFGFIYTVVFFSYFNTQFTIMTFLNNYIFNIFVTSVCSYLYNQSSSFLPGMFALGTIELVVLIWNIL